MLLCVISYKQKYFHPRNGSSFVVIGVYVYKKSTKILKTIRTYVDRSVDESILVLQA